MKNIYIKNRFQNHQQYYRPLANIRGPLNLYNTKNVVIYCLLVQACRWSIWICKDEYPEYDKERTCRLVKVKFFLHCLYFTALSNGWSHQASWPNTHVGSGFSSRVHHLLLHPAEWGRARRRWCFHGKSVISPSSGLFHTKPEPYPNTQNCNASEGQKCWTPPWNLNI